MFKHLIVAAIIIVAPTSSYAEHHHELFQQAKALMKYSKQVQPPETVAVSPSYIKKNMCPDTDTCEVTAFYYKEKVYYDNRLDMKDPIDRSIIVHEYIHHIQRTIHGPTRDCLRWLKNEVEAYELQATYLKQQKASTKPVEDAIFYVKCPTRGN